MPLFAKYYKIKGSEEKIFASFCISITYEQIKRTANTET